MRPAQSGYESITHPFPPLYDKNSRILILGSFPSVKSRETVFFYGHPQNRFWKTLAGVLSQELPVNIDEKREFLLRNRIAVWDVIRSCDIIGSSDSSIRNVVANDLSVILKAADIRQIFCNGAKSYEYYNRYIREKTGMDARKLPSTSPANAAYSLEDLKEEWKVICEPLKAAPAGIGETLLAWYDHNARILPWRSDPSPYHVWISEIMLQQTRVEAVLPYYYRWMEELPDIDSLAKVPDERLLKLWEGLGYYNRARNLKAAARMVVEYYGGELPADYQELRKLAGVGAYTAGAIASIAFGLPRVAVDGNVLRIFSRLLSEAGEIDRAGIKRFLAAEAERVMPESRPGDYNQALMDLGAGICIPNGRPLCGTCPFEHVCLAHRSGRETDYPVRAKKSPRRVEKRGIFVILTAERDQKETGCVALHKRPEKGLLSNLWEFPNLSGDYTLEKAREQMSRWGFTDYEIEHMGDRKHIFTHLEWQMHGYLVRVKEIPQVLLETEGWCVVPAETVRDNYAMPSAFDNYRKQLLLRFSC